MKTFFWKPGVQSFVLLQLTLASSWTGTTPASASCWTGSSQDCVKVRDRIFHYSDGREQIPSLAGGDWREIDEEVRGRADTDDKRSRRKKKWKENLSREREKTAGVNQTRFSRQMSKQSGRCCSVRGLEESGVLAFSTGMFYRNLIWGTSGWDC